MVAVEKPYVFIGPAGELGLADLFEGRRRLVACAGEDVRVRRERADRADRGHRAHGVDLPLVLVARIDFTDDVHVTVDETRAPVEYDYRSEAGLERVGLTLAGWEQPFDLHGPSVFLRDDGRVLHSYSARTRAARTTSASRATCST